jgi:hypothetical protein
MCIVCIAHKWLAHEPVAKCAHMYLLSAWLYVNDSLLVYKRYITIAETWVTTIYNIKSKVK